MSMKLRELIRQVRGAKTQTEERAVVAKESANIRDSFKAGENSYRHRNIAKLLFFHLLGYPSSFGQMECVKLCASAKFSEKRIGYLALSLLLEPGSEILFLVTNSIKQDLVGNDELAAAAALALLANSGSAEMCTALVPSVYELLLHPSANIRKKAAIACIRVCALAPDDTDKFFFRLLSLLDGGGVGQAAGQAAGGVTLAACAALEALLSARPSLADSCPVGTVARVLRKVQQVGGGSSGEFEFPGGTTDPFAQVALLRLVRRLGKTDATVEELLAQTATNTESTKNAGCAVLYECAQTILQVSKDTTLRTLAINVLGKFLVKPKEETVHMQYVALQALQTAAKSASVDSPDEKAVQRHRGTILECLNHADLSIRRRALEICVRLTNETNFKSVSKELLNYLATNAESDFKFDLVEKVAAAAEKFSSDFRQYFDVVLKLCKLAGCFVSEQTVNTTINVLLASGNEQLQTYATIQLLNVVRTQHTTDTRDALLVLTVYVLGEFGHLLTAAVPTAELLEVLEDFARIGLLQGQNAVATDFAAVRTGIQLCQFIASALVKLAAKLPPQYLPRIIGILGKFENSLHPDLQQRCCEYLVLLRQWPEQQRRALLEKMPAQTLPAVFADRPVGTVGNADLEISAKVVSSAASAKVDIDDLLGPDNSGEAAGNRKRPVLSGADSLLDILDEIAPDPRRSSAAADGSQVVSSRRIQEPKSTAAVSVDLHGTKAGADLQLTATFRAVDTSQSVENLVFEVAVPRYLKLTIQPASGTALFTATARITQDFAITNTEPRDKAVLLKFRLSYLQDGRPVSETGQVANL